MAHPAGPRHAEEIHHGGAPPRPQAPDQLLMLAPNVWPRNTVRGDDGVVSIAGVKVTDIAATHAAIVARGAKNERAPHLTAKMPDHELWAAFVRDPDGNLIGLMEEKR